MYCTYTLIEGIPNKRGLFLEEEGFKGTLSQLLIQNHQQFIFLIYMDIVSPMCTPLTADIVFKRWVHMVLKLLIHTL
jgi:hypothetical protein